LSEKVTVTFLKVLYLMFEPDLFGNGTKNF